MSTLVVAGAQAFPAPAWVQTELIAVAHRPESTRRARGHVSRFALEATRANLLQLTAQETCELTCLEVEALTNLAAQVTQRAVRATVSDILGDLLFNGTCLPTARLVVHRLGMSWTHQQDTAVDLADKTFVHLFHLLEAGKVPEAILQDQTQWPPWLYSVCRNLAYDEMRACGRQMLPTIAEAAVPDLPDSSERWAQHAETLSFFLDVCGSDLERQIVELKAQGRSFREIAETLAVAESLVRKRFGQIQARARSRWARL